MSVIVPMPDLKTICRKARVGLQKVHTFLGLVKRAMEPFAKRIGVIENGTLRYYVIERRGLGILKTKYGKFWEYSFAIDDQWQRYSVIVKAELDLDQLTPIFQDKKCIFLRTDSGCETC